jgi:hypothetical protein
MKKLIYIISVLILVAGVSCDQDEYLEETPKDFLTPENSFTSKAGFEAALGGMYLGNRSHFYNADRPQLLLFFGIDVDLAVVANNARGVYNEAFWWNTFNADNGFPMQHWSFFYAQIFKANTIIERSESDAVTWTSEEEKNAIVGEAKFLRAYYYRFLANLWGGVPLVLEETAGAKFDYTRATREQVYQQCLEDLTFATQWMPTVDEVPGGRAPRAAAYHVLAEVNIQLGNYQEAINAASAVIDGGNYALMTERFGRFKNFKWRGYDYTGPAEPWGDVYFDLFRVGNFNRIEGNMETIWNIQLEYETEGGTDRSNVYGSFGWERAWGGAAYWSANFQKDINNVPNLYKDTLMGRAVGWGIATDYMVNQVWNFKDDFDRDIRNSKYNVQRTWYWNNPASEFFGTPVNAETIFDPNFMQTGRTAPAFKKNITAFHEQIRIQDGENTDNGQGFKDWYIIRLAETYLLRAEAYHLKGDNQNAANDINAVRNRAHATPVSAGEVDLDLILDERARELYAEEYRMNTLCRMGKLVEYLRKYNSAVVQYGYVLGDHLNLMPIPNREIEANKEADLEQNPGYE